jgi:hypothetical protein
MTYLNELWTSKPSLQALAEERERAQEIENKHPNVHIMDGPLGRKMVTYPVFYPLHSNAL